MDTRSLLLKLYRFILTRRYTVHLKGVKNLQLPGAKLILPNHQSHIDPQLMAVITAAYGDFVPVISEVFLKIPVLNYFIKKLNPVAVSNIKRGNRDPEVLSKIFSKVKDALMEEKIVIIYPSGQITHTPYERIHNKQSAYVIVQNLPDNTRVVGVRISGLWGSMWSVAWHGERPNFLFAYLKAIFYFFANFIFFLPKRNVYFEFVDITKEAKLKAKGDRKQFNKYLEDFYNVNEIEKATYIKHLFFFPKLRRNYPNNL